MTTLAIVRPLAASAYRLHKGKTSAGVFLSCRGGDPRTAVTDFLYKSLEAVGLRVVRDNAAHPVCEQMNPEVLRAIRTCRIAIPIISDHYAQSKSCLREIMDCHRKHGKSVFPILYTSDADDLGRQRRIFEEALRAQQCRQEEVAEWVEALCSLTRIKGLMSQAISNGHIEKLVKMVVAKVSSDLETTWIERCSSLFMRSGWIAVYYYFMKRERRELEKKRRECQVFLAFRGPDTRDNLAAYLYTSLVAEGIKVFSDDDLLKGEHVQELYRTIHRCKISIAILSENFASSAWCLDDLAQMVECKRTKGQKILPIFYKVEPSHMRDLSHSFGEHMLRQKKQLDECTFEWVDKTVYERWERALKEVGSSKGWVSEKIANGDERELVNQVVKEVSRLLNMH
ncbi:TIR domain-containing protein [Psidium guajava]|nr:TIR domain-containing protein [Psidium guajava]